VHFWFCKLNQEMSWTQEEGSSGSEEENNAISGCPTSRKQHTNAMGIFEMEQERQDQQVLEGLSQSQ
jgi:hypothetical protein